MVPPPPAEDAVAVQMARPTGSWMDGALTLMGCEAWGRDDLEALARRELVALCAGAARHHGRAAASPASALRVAVGGEEEGVSLPQPSTPCCGVLVEGCARMGYLPTKAASVKFSKWLSSLDVGLECHSVGGAQTLEPADDAPGILNMHAQFRARPAVKSASPEPLLTTAHVGTLSAQQPHDGADSIAQWASEAMSPTRLPRQPHAKCKAAVPVCAAAIMKRGVDGRLVFTDAPTVGVDVAVGALVAAAAAGACLAGFEYRDPPPPLPAVAAVAATVAKAAAVAALHRPRVRRARAKPQEEDVAEQAPCARFVVSHEDKAFEHRLLTGSASTSLQANKREAENLHHFLRMLTRAEGRMKNEPNWQASMDETAVLQPFAKRHRTPKVVRGQTVTRLPGAQVADPMKREQRELAREVRWQRADKRTLVDQEKVYVSNATALARLLPPITGDRSPKPGSARGGPTHASFEHPPDMSTRSTRSQRSTGTGYLRRHDASSQSPRSAGPPSEESGRRAPQEDLSPRATYRDIQLERGWTAVVDSGRHLEDRRGVLDHLLKQQAASSKAVQRRRRDVSRKDREAFTHGLHLAAEEAARRGNQNYDKSKPQFPITQNSFAALAPLPARDRLARTLPHAGRTRATYREIGGGGGGPLWQTQPARHAVSFDAPSPPLAPLAEAASPPASSAQPVNYWDRYNQYVAASRSGGRRAPLRSPPDATAGSAADAHDDALRHTLLVKTSPLAGNYKPEDLALLGQG
eukprot:TRINITY_DN28219_c0_g1_i1.p1 TRINITY_DN28219_c0_g1~~TRINITY_DN28219_c0_g1_i1.p1  ORF type:complete len:751 (+),score=230.33 TRINITY_DN28219_c0_g1_i1:67-2319(+)